MQVRACKPHQTRRILTAVSHLELRAAPRVLNGARPHQVRADVSAASPCAGPAAPQPTTRATVRPSLPSTPGGTGSLGSGGAGSRRARPSARGTPSTRWATRTASSRLEAASSAPTDASRLCARRSVIIDPRIQSLARQASRRALRGRPSQAPAPCSLVSLRSRRSCALLCRKLIDSGGGGYRFHQPLAASIGDLTELQNLCEARYSD